MSFSEVQNPRALADLVDRFRKRFSEKKCMSPLSDHEGGIVSAHTLSLEAMLRKIAIDSHVYVVGQTRLVIHSHMKYKGVDCETLVYLMGFAKNMIVSCLRA